MKLVARHLVGVALSALGATLLSVALEQILDPEKPADLVLRAAIAAGASVVVFVAAGILAGLAAWLSKPSEKASTAWAVISVASVPAGVALSLAISFVISAAAATIFAADVGAAITVAGIALVAGGFFLSHGFWVNVGKRVLGAIRPPADPGSAPDGTDPAPAQS